MSRTESRESSTIVDAITKVGARIRELRIGRNLTLEALAERSGVSRAMLSKVERGEKNPTLMVTAKVAEGLDVTISQLVGIQEQRDVVVVPKARRIVMKDAETGFERQMLSPAFPARGVEFIRNVIPQGSTSGEFPPHKRGVEEYIVVERGRMTAVLDGKEYQLEEGDAIYFEADVPHRFENGGQGECSYYLVINSSRI